MNPYYVPLKFLKREKLIPTPVKHKIDHVSRTLWVEPNDLGVRLLLPYFKKAPLKHA